MPQVRKRIVELVTKVTGSAELKKTETALRKIDKSTAGTNRQLATMSKRLNSASVSMNKLVAAAATFSGLKGFSALVRATAQQEQAVIQLNAVLKSTEGIAGKTSEELQNLASSLQAVTTFGDEAIIGAQSLLLSFKEIRGVNFDRTLESILDLSIAMGQDLKTSTIQLGKALNDPVRGLGALSRVGIQFNDDQRDLIKSLTETNRVAEAQVIILKEVESQYKDSAREARKGLGGALQALKNAFADLLEADSGGITPLVKSVNELSDTFTDPEFKRSIQDIVNDILRLGGAGLTVMTNFGGIVNFVKDEVLALYGVVDDNDLVRLLEKQASLQDRLNATGFSALLRDTEGLEKQLEEVNAQIAKLESKANGPILITPTPAAAPTAPEDSRSPILTIDPDATLELEKSSQLFIDLRHNMEWLDQHAAEASKKMEVAQKAFNDEMERANELFAQFNPEVAQYQNGMYDLEDALRLGILSQAEFDEKARKLEETLARSQEGWSLSKEAINLFSDSFETMLDGVLQGTQSISDGFKDMAKVVIAQLVKLAAYKAIFATFGLDLGLPTANAKGNVIDKGTVVPFATGGIVNSPTLFPMKTGMGLMGEAGPEAILPLQRGAGGNLGIAAAPVNVTVNNMASGVRVNTRETSEGLTLDVVMEQVSSAIRRGGNPISNSIEDSYSLGRGRSVY